MAEGKLNVTEVVFFVGAVLFAILAMISFGYARYVWTHGGGSGFGPGLEIGGSIIAGVVLSGVGSFLAFFVRQQDTLSLKRGWWFVSRLNYCIFVVGGIYLLSAFVKCKRLTSRYSQRPQAAVADLKR